MSETYIDKLLSGHAGLEDFDDVVDEWHERYGPAPDGQYPQIYEYMGLTWPEYSLIMRKRGNLRVVLAARKRGEDLAALMEAQTDWALAARSSDDSQLLALIARLKSDGELKA